MVRACGRIPIGSPPRRPNSVSKLGSNLPPLRGNPWGSRMFRTMWLALFCLVGLGAAMAIKLAAPQAVLVADPARDQRNAEPAFALDEAAKSDRLELPDARAETGIVVPSAKTMPAATASIPPVTISKIAEPHWEDANAMIEPVASPHHEPKARPPKKIVAKSVSTAKTSSTERPEAWHCRQDTMGSLLRSLNLSPRCNL
jgi:hypothetical protein